MNIDVGNLTNYRINLETNSLSSSNKKSKNIFIINKETSGFIGLDKLWEIYNVTEDIE